MYRGKRVERFKYPAGTLKLAAFIPAWGLECVQKPSFANGVAYMSVYCEVLAGESMTPIQILCGVNFIFNHEYK